MKKTTKPCIQCGVSKLVCDFRQHKRKKTITYNAKCKECDKSYARELYANNKQYRDKCLARSRKQHLSPEQKEIARINRKEYKRKLRLDAGITPRYTIEYKIASLRKKEAVWLRIAQKAEAVSAFRYWIMERASSESVAAYYTDKPWNNPRLSGAEQYKLRYKTDSDFNLKERLRRQLSKKRKGGVADNIRSAISRGGNSNVVERLCGYTVAELKCHLEKQFTKDMNWRAFNKGEIHIDHITPIKNFNLQDEQDFKQCWSLSNLMPLWAKDNLVKSAKQYYLI